MPMSKRDYEVIATVVREHGDDLRAELAFAFAFEFAADNPRFDRELFVAACTAEPRD